MLSIDEVIAHEREVAKNKREHIDECNKKNNYACKFCVEIRTCKEVAEEHEQLADWLEELVMLRLDRCMIHMPERLHLVENGYNKALDDFVKFANTLPTVEEEDGTIRPMWLEEMAEQLKAGESE